MKNILKKFGRWTLARARERSTAAGLAIIVGAIAGPAVGTTVGNVGTALALILGGAMTGATTRPSDPQN